MQNIIDFLAAFSALSSFHLSILVSLGGLFVAALAIAVVFLIAKERSGGRR